MIWLLAGCLTLDGFFFEPVAVDQYTLSFEIIPETQVETVTFPSEDGSATLYGVWAHQETPGAPMYLYFHGNAENIDVYWDRVEYFWGLGFETFIFDYQGFGRSEGTPSYDNVMADGRSAVAYVTATTGLPPIDMVFHGLSLGGSVAVHTAVDLPPKVLITEDMFASAQKLINDGSGLDLPPGWFNEDPWDNSGAARQVHRPYLITHGAEDSFVQPSNGEQVYTHANEPKLLWLVPGADHGESIAVAPDDYATYITCWIAQDCTNR